MKRASGYFNSVSQAFWARRRTTERFCEALRAGLGAPPIPRARSEDAKRAREACRAQGDGHGEARQIPDHTRRCVHTPCGTAFAREACCTHPCGTPTGESFAAPSSAVSMQSLSPMPWAPWPSSLELVWETFVVCLVYCVCSCCTLGLPAIYAGLMPYI